MVTKSLVLLMMMLHLSASVIQVVVTLKSQFDLGQDIALPGSDLNMLFQLRSPLTTSGSLMLTLLGAGTCMIILAMVAMCL
jgi:hypothetical protein